MQYVKGMNTRTGETILFRTSDRQRVLGVIPDPELVNHVMQMRNTEIQQKKRKLTVAQCVFGFFSGCAFGSVIALLYSLVCGTFTNVIEFVLCFAVSYYVAQAAYRVVKCDRIFQN
jgi:hypothetical protein